jgi:hypothetical protein
MTHMDSNHARRARRAYESYRGCVGTCEVDERIYTVIRARARRLDRRSEGVVGFRRYRPITLILY